MKIDQLVAAYNTRYPTAQITLEEVEAYLAWCANGANKINDATYFRYRPIFERLCVIEGKPLEEKPACSNEECDKHFTCLYGDLFRYLEKNRITTQHIACLDSTTCGQYISNYSGLYDDLHEGHLLCAAMQQLLLEVASRDYLVRGREGTLLWLMKLFSYSFLRNELERTAAVLYITGNRERFVTRPFTDHIALLQSLEALAERGREEELPSYWARIRSNVLARRVMLAELTARCEEIQAKPYNNRHKWLLRGIISALSYLNTGEYMADIQFVEEGHWEFYPVHSQLENGYRIELSEIEVSGLGQSAETAMEATVRAAIVFAKKYQQSIPAEWQRWDAKMQRKKAYVDRIIACEENEIQVRALLRLDQYF